MPRSRARVVHGDLARIQLLPAELKQHVLLLAFTAPCVPLSALLGTIGLLVLTLFTNDDEAQLNTAIYALSRGSLSCIADIRHTSLCMYKLMDPHHSKALALDFLEGLFQRQDDLEYYMRLYDHMLIREDTFLRPRYIGGGWRSAKVLLYAAPRGQTHTDTHVYKGLLHAFDFNNDILNPLGIDRDDLSRITYHKNMDIPLLTYQKYEALLSSRDMGVFAAVVHVTPSCVFDDQVNTFSYLAPATCTKRDRRVSISRFPLMERHLCDVWREWPESLVLAQ